MKLSLFGSHDPKDLIEIEADCRELDLNGKDFTLGDTVVRIHCDVRTRAILQCSRCLDKYTQDIEGDFEIVARRLRTGESHHEYPEYDIKDDDTKLIYLEHDENMVDITDLVRDAIILTVPLKPICSDNCKGLCSICGHNLNQGECGCKSERIDSRWNRLSQLLDDK